MRGFLGAREYHTLRVSVNRVKEWARVRSYRKRTTFTTIREEAVPVHLIGPGVPT